jgi:phosphonoacetaldehyde hydrolase
VSFPVKAVVFDWAGTMIDFGCMAPIRALVDVFEAEGIVLSVEEARRDMGKAKLDHVRALLADPGIRARWLQDRLGHGLYPRDDGRHPAQRR